MLRKKGGSSFPRKYQSKKEKAFKLKQKYILYMPTSAINGYVGRCGKSAWVLFVCLFQTSCLFVEKFVHV